MDMRLTHHNIVPLLCRCQHIQPAVMHKKCPAHSPVTKCIAKSEGASRFYLRSNLLHRAQILRHISWLSAKTPQVNPHPKAPPWESTGGRVCDITRRRIIGLGFDHGGQNADGTSGCKPSAILPGRRCGPVGSRCGLAPNDPHFAPGGERTR